MVKPKAKTIAGHSVSGIVVLIASLLISILTGNEQMIGKLIGTALNETIDVPAENAQEGEVMTLVISKDGDIILNSEKIQLAGGLDFQGKKGDAIMFQMVNGVWVQFYVSLVDTEDFK